MKIWWHKFKHWEYWSANVVYLPTFFYWVWMMLKFRSVKFYKFSNPSIKHGGFIHDSKMDIYKLLPTDIYPKTVLIKKNQAYDFEKTISDNYFNFPVILKPDVGLRGIDVVKVDTVEEIIKYYQSQDKDFLIQEYIDLPNEIGLFYCRLPNQNTGKIT